MPRTTLLHHLRILRDADLIAVQVHDSAYHQYHVRDEHYGEIGAAPGGLPGLTRGRGSAPGTSLLAAEQRPEDAADEVLAAREVITRPAVRTPVGTIRLRAFASARAWRAAAARSRSAARWAAAISRAWRAISRCCWAGVIVFMPPAVVGGTPAAVACWAAACRGGRRPRRASRDHLVGALAVDVWPYFVASGLAATRGLETASAIGAISESGGDEPRRRERRRDAARRQHRHERLADPRAT